MGEAAFFRSLNSHIKLLADAVALMAVGIYDDAASHIVEFF